MFALVIDKSCKTPGNYRLTRYICMMARHGKSCAATAVILANLVALPAFADMKPTLAFSGVTGLIDMPSGESQPDGSLAVTKSVFGPIGRTTLTFQIAPRLSGSFRYTSFSNWDDVIPSPLATNLDRSFDLRYQLVNETTYLPAVSIGIQDIIGTGLMAGEYLVATKSVGKTVKVTAGLGWGRLGSYGAIGAPFGARPVADVGLGGRPRLGEWFKGDVAPFAGVEWQVTKRIGLKAEYSSDNYSTEADYRKTFDRNSPFNFGLEYQAMDMLRVGVYSLYGSEIGFSAQIILDPKRSPAGGQLGGGPLPIKNRPGSKGWTQDTVFQSGPTTTLRDSLQKLLAADGIVIESLAVTERGAQVRIRNTRIDSGPQAIGRTSRAMAAVLPASVEIFEIVPVADGLPLSKVVLRRTDLEALEFAPDQDAELLARRQIVALPGQPPSGAVMGKGLYPRFDWGLAPYVRTALFDPDNPIRIDVGLRATAQYDIAPGLVLSGSMTKKIAGNLDQSTRVSNSILPHVRSDSNLYDRDGDPAIENLTLAFYSKPTPDLYSRVTVGYLERMYGGVSAELLWKRVDKPYALGVEVNYVKQRNFDQLLGFRNYSIVTGHVSGYYAFDNGFQAQLDVGRYLAGDFGATLSVDREFSNGWKVGAFATLTDVPFDDFGEGSFDKGIKIEIPFAWALGKQTRKTYQTTIRPILRDGGARVDVDGRLYDTIREYHAADLDAKWGRFWK